MKAGQNLYLIFTLCLIIPLIDNQTIIAQQKSLSIADTTQNVIRNTHHNINWIRFASQLKNNNRLPHHDVIIVHLGDSHIQGGYFTNRVRELFSQKYGIQERGFIFPYTLLKANGPEDVRFYSSAAWQGQKYNHAVSKDKAGISGYHLAMLDSTGSMQIRLTQGSDKLYPFSELVAFYENPHFQIFAKTAVQTTTDSIEPGLYATKMIFNGPKDSVLLNFCKKQESNELYGFELLNNKHGIVYNSVGINGASYESYANAINYMTILKALKPDCIMISLGTNDAFSEKLDTLLLKKRIVSMIEILRKEFPDACILLTTPGDHLLHKRYLNDNLIKTSSVIITTAIEQHCVFWDFFNVMGGLGASKKWSKNGFMYKDMLHLSKKGYTLQGDLFFEALNKAIERTSAKL